MTSSFPSGHATSDLAFAIGAAQELPLAFLPLSACTMAVHWSLVRKRAHYSSDVLAGGALRIARGPRRVEAVAAPASHEADPPRVAPGADDEGADGRYGSDGSTDGADEPLPGVGSGTGLR